MDEASGGRSFTFLIPLVHPDGGKISDYRTVEAILRETLASLAAVTHAQVRVAVVCHHRPDWHRDCAGNVTFLTFGDHPAFAANRSDVRTDKARKYLCGLLWALADHGPRAIMPMDGDDFVRRDIARIAFERLEGAGVDGLNVDGGYHVALRPSGDGFEVNGVFAVESFSSTCGSNRIFEAGRLAAIVAGTFPEFEALRSGPVARDDGALEPAVLNTVAAFADRTCEDRDGLIQVLGRHHTQAGLFDLAPLYDPVAAKGCGHGNHDGPRAGAIHFHRIVEVSQTERFLKAFGLDGRASMVARPSDGLQRRGRFARRRNQLNRAVRGLFGG